MYESEVERNDLKYCALCHTQIDFRKFGQKNEDDWYVLVISYDMNKKINVLGSEMNVKAGILKGQLKSTKKDILTTRGKKKKGEKFAWYESINQNGWMD